MRMENSMVLSYLLPFPVHFIKKEQHLFSIRYLPWLKEKGIYIGTLKMSYTIFGKLNTKDDFILNNHILLLGIPLVCIYSSRNSKCQNTGFFKSLCPFLNRGKNIALQTGGYLKPCKSIINVCTNLAQ